jgi:hypothetical protein
MDRGLGGFRSRSGRCEERSLPLHRESNPDSSTSKVLEELVFIQLNKKFPALYGIPKFMSQMNPVHPPILFP